MEELEKYRMDGGILNSEMRQRRRRWADAIVHAHRCAWLHRFFGQTVSEAAED